jgi:tyrosyl-tRNA synthetase
MEEILKGIEIILPEDSLKEKLEESQKTGKPLVVKLGFDPTAPDLHLGHLITLKKLREFQDLGHEIVLIVGDFTAQIGDPSGKNKTRPPLNKQEIKANAKTYIKQLGKVIDVRKVRVQKNSAWFKKMDLADTLQLMGQYNLGRMLTRDDFANRLKSDSPIAMHEIVYPLLQGHDSLKIEADIEIGGTDQLFNMQVGRHLQEANGQKAQTVLCMPLLRGLDGTKKMSKSLGNYIGLTDEPNDMFGKVMSIPDDLLPEYINLVTNFKKEEKDQMLAQVTSQPLETKKMIAANIVTQLHSEEDAKKAEEYFQNQFQNKDDASKEYKDVNFASLGLGDEVILVDLLVVLNVRESKSAARQLIESGGVQVDGEKVTDPVMKIETGKSEMLIRAGKLNFFRIIFD